MPIKDALLPELDHEAATTRRLLERVPEDKLDWRPHPRSMTAGELATHVATLPQWGSMTMESTEYDVARGERAALKTTRHELLAAFDESVAKTRKAIDAAQDAEFMVPWSLKHEEKTVFTMPRVTVLRSFVMNHLVHHRGQLSVYLRLLDVPVPSIYGPSADEQ